MYLFVWVFYCLFGLGGEGDGDEKGGGGLITTSHVPGDFLGWRLNKNSLLLYIFCYTKV